MRIRSSLLLLFLFVGPGSAIAQTPEIPDAPAPPSEPKARAASPDEDAPAPAPERVRGKKRLAPSADAEALAPAAEEPTAPAAEGAGFLRLAPSLSGETGLLRVAAAESSAPKLIRLSLGLDFYSASGVFGTGDDSSRFGGALSVSGSPTNYFELWLSTRTQSTRSSLTTPNLLQAQGDLSLGAKGFYPLSPMFSIGGDVQATFLSSIGKPIFDLGASIAQIRALVTADFRKHPTDIPLRAHLNVGVIFDGSDSLMSTPLSNAERYALGVSDFNRFTTGIGIEVPVKYVTPFLEYTLEVPLGYVATPGIVLTQAGLMDVRTNVSALRTEQSMVQTNLDASPVAHPSIGRVMPQRITPGVRVTAIKDLTLDAAVEIGITQSVGTGVIATPPYNVIVLASYAFDPWSERSGAPVTVPVLVPDVKEVESTPKTGLVNGVVLNQNDGRPIEGAVISFDRSPPVATESSGRFVSHEIEPGPVKITLNKEGFETRSASASIDAGATKQIKVSLVPSVREGSVRGKIMDNGGAPVPNAVVAASGANQGEAPAEGGNYELKLKEGEYLVIADASGFYKKMHKVHVQNGKIETVDFTVRKRVQPPIADLSRGMIRLKQRIPFVGREAKLAPNAPAVLDAVIDAIASHPEAKKVQIEGHTDNAGEEASNQKLSEDRANAVMTYLVNQGVPQERLEAVGYGGTRPIAPNLTQRGRDQNMRIELHVAE
jgi:outer membrane protein OmpA-like peptidoglycan-associated protein